jgi:2-oxoglutarate dehydrogenase E2 component (dihydrolipoamide succinyltransferase)
MATEIRVPTLGESITEATVGKWLKQAGDTVKIDDLLVELETDKVTVEVPSPVSGVLGQVAATEGDVVEIGALLGSISEGSAGAAETAPAPAAAPAPAPAMREVAVAEQAPLTNGASAGAMPASPAARRILDEGELAVADVVGSGRRGQVLKEDVAVALEARRLTEPPPSPAPRPAVQEARPAPAPTPAPNPAPAPASARQVSMPVPASDLRVPSTISESQREERVKMTRLRQTIANRLKDAQNTAAMLTTFNDADMTAVMAMRAQYKDLFERRHGVKLGFMGFFVKACIQALREIPAVNAEIDGEEIIYKNYYHIGVAVGTKKGLVVPVLRETDRMSIVEIEAMIADFGKRARDGKLSIADMQGGTFTISNGGVYGSMLSTPILNAPQSGILGMHRIEERPVVRDGQIVARPMMYLALSYDHRIVDGKEAVTFLARVKDCLEDPQRFILEL